MATLIPPGEAREIQLLHKELEAQGELLSRERLERLIETDKLKLQFEALRKCLAELEPEAQGRYERIYRQLLQEFDPSSHKESA